MTFLHLLICLFRKCWLFPKKILLISVWASLFFFLFLPQVAAWHLHEMFQQLFEARVQHPRHSRIHISAKAETNSAGSKVCTLYLDECLYYYESLIFKFYFSSWPQTAVHLQQFYQDMVYLCLSVWWTFSSILKETPHLSWIRLSVSSFCLSLLNSL